MFSSHCYKGRVPRCRETQASNAVAQCAVGSRAIFARGTGGKMKKNFDWGTQSEHSKETLLKMLVCPLKNMHTSDSIYRVHQQDVVCISQTCTTLSPPPQIFMKTWKASFSLSISGPMSWCWRPAPARLLFEADNMTVQHQLLNYRRPKSNSLC